MTSRVSRFIGLACRHSRNTYTLVGASHTPKNPASDDAALVLTSTRSALSIWTLARGGCWDPARASFELKLTPTGPNGNRPKVRDHSEEPGGSWAATTVPKR
jgi:hypothetical protein